LDLPGEIVMTNSPHDSLIRGLASDLKPVRRLPRPMLRAFGWLGIVCVVALGLAVFSDLPAIRERIAEAPDLWLAVLGSTATAVLAAIAAFQLSLPDAPRAWAWLPLPGVILWIGASSFGCLRTFVVPAEHAARLDETRDCIVFIIALSVPLSALMFAMLRRGCPLEPGLTAATGGLAVAAAAATLLNFFHPFDATATDLAVHAIAVALVVIVDRMVGNRILSAA